MSRDPVEDCVSKTTLLTVGLTSANASANVLVASSQALSLAMINAVANQQMGNVTRQAANIQGTSGLYSTSDAVNSSIVGGLANM